MKHVCARLFERVDHTSCFREHKVKAGQISEIVLAGGPTCNPALKSLFERAFGKAPSKMVNRDECVACGTSIMTQMMSSTVN